MAEIGRQDDPLLLYRIRDRALDVFGRGSDEYARIETAIRPGVETALGLNGQQRSFMIFDGDELRYYDSSGQLRGVYPASPAFPE